MKVLFVSRGNGYAPCNPIVRNQGDSLAKQGTDVEYFSIRGGGLMGYARSIIQLRRLLRNRRFGVVHAHYAWSGFAAALAGARPLVVSLMGSDVLNSRIVRGLTTVAFRRRWSSIIVKSEEMKSQLGIPSVQVIPNGVDMQRFRPLPKKESRATVGFSEKKHVLFIGNPARPEKKISLARKAIDLLDDPDVEFHVLFDKPHDMLPLYLNAADVLLLTSTYEGSPNVIKEAMACGLPIVATEVGDIRWVCGSTPGCFLCSPSPEDVAEKLKLSLDFTGSTAGRSRILKLALDADRISERINLVYEAILAAQ